MRGRRGTLCHRWSPCVARVGPGDIDSAFLWFSQSGLAQLFCSFFPWLCFCASGGPFCPLSCPSPSKRTFLARLLFICLAVLLALSGCPFWPLSGPNPSKRTSQLSQSWFAWRCSLLFLVARLGKRAAEILQSGLAQLFFCFVSSFLLWLCFCAPFSLWYSVLSAERPKSSKTDRPSFHSSSARLRSLLCRVVRFGLLAAQILQNGPPQLFHAL